MNLIVNTYGASVRRRGAMVVVKADGEEKSVSIRRIRSIWISSAASVTTDVLELALEHNIDVVLLNRFGSPFGRVWHGRPGSTTAIRRAQLRLAESGEGTRVALGWVKRKILNQIAFLKKARTRRTRLSAELSAAARSLDEAVASLEALEGPIADLRGMVLGLEGRAGRTWWQAVNLLLPPSARFAARSRNPALDPFNALLNYAYGVLYGKVERACVLAGLDPYAGFIHTDHYRKVSLVFDLIECYRIWADEVVIGLFARRKVKALLFDKCQNGLTLNKEGKEVLIGALMTHLEETIRYKGRNVRREHVVQLDCHAFANQLLSNGES